MNLPEDFKEKMKKLLGSDWPRFFECCEKDRYQAMRLNPLKKGLTEELRIALLQRFDAKEQVPWEPNGYYYGSDLDGALTDGPAGQDSSEADLASALCGKDTPTAEDAPRPGKHVYHEAGLYYIQEPSAMSAAALLAPEPGMRVLDLCAAPGGKSTQLAGYLMQRGLLVANEIHPARAKILAQNVERMGIANAIVTNEDSGTLAAQFPSFFHAILVDAPCSGEGMFRKNPEALKEWSAGQVIVCAERQREILDNAAAMLLPGGTLVYSTCTFSTEENEETIDWFLKQHPEFSVKEVDAPWFTKDAGQGTFRLWPHKLHGEGHFAAVLQKAGVLPEYDGQTAFGGSADDRLPLGMSSGGTVSTGKTTGKGKKNPGRERYGGERRTENQPLLEAFLQENIMPEQSAWIKEGRLTMFGDQLYRLPEGAPYLKGIRVLRAGLHIGEFKKNRFEPSHALALFLGADEVRCSLNLPADDARIAGFLRGESIFLSDEEQKTHVRTSAGSAGKGWCLVCADGCSLGWGKLAGSQIKNHYPKGLRRDVS